jgi:hypothetical protein
VEESPICALLLEWNRNTLTARRLSSAALKEFRSFWSNYRWRVTIVGIFNLPIVVSYFRHRINMLDMLTPPVTAFVVLWSRRPVLMPLRYLKEAERLDADSRDAHVKALAQLDDCIANYHRQSLSSSNIGDR